VGLIPPAEPPASRGKMITESQIRAALRNAPTCGKKSIELKDNGTRGEGRLALIVRPLAGSIAAEWYAVFYSAGKRSLTKMGSYPTLGLVDARKAFRESYAPSISAGSRPSGPRTRKRAGVTVGDLFNAYITHLEATAKPETVASARSALMGTVKRGGGAAAAIGASRRAADVRPEHIIPHLSAIHGRGSIVMARHVRSFVSAAFSFAMKSSNSYTQPSGGLTWGITSNPVLAIPVDPEAFRVGERHLTAAEFRAFWEWLSARETRSGAASALLLVMATGQRPTEILRITDSRYDRNDGSVNWAQTKNDKPHIIPLPAQAVEILNRLVPNREGLFFPGRRRADLPLRYCAPGEIVATYVREVGAAHFTARDLRRTWKTTTGAAGLSKEIRDRLQNHARQDVSSRHYDRYEYLAEKRAAMATWSAYLARILAGEFDPVESGRGGQPISLPEIRARQGRSQAA